jgi:hypothetical protein
MGRWHKFGRVVSVMLAAAAVGLILAAVAWSRPAPTLAGGTGSTAPARGAKAAPARSTATLWVPRAPAIAAITAAAPTCTNQFLVTPVNTPLTGTGSCTDPDGDPLTYTVDFDPQSGTLVLAPDGSFTYTPNAGFTGTDFFGVEVSDPGMLTNFAFVEVRVGANAPPVATDDVYSVRTGTPKQLFVTNNDDDPDGDELHITANTAAAHGTVTCSEFFCTYTSNAGYLGPDSFTYTVADDFGATDTATVSLTVTVNHAPTPQNDTANIEPGSSGNLIDVLANDTDPDDDILTIVSASDPLHGTVACSSFDCTYAPDPGYVGPDSVHVHRHRRRADGDSHRQHHGRHHARRDLVDRPSHPHRHIPDPQLRRQPRR